MPNNFFYFLSSSPLSPQPSNLASLPTRWLQSGRQALGSLQRACLKRACLQLSCRQSAPQLQGMAADSSDKPAGVLRAPRRFFVQQPTSRLNTPSRPINHSVFRRSVFRRSVIGFPLIWRQYWAIALVAACLAALPLGQRQNPSSSFGAGAMGITAGRADPEAGDPVQFSAEELKELQRRFGVHGPQPRLTQLLSEGIDQLQPLRNNTLARIEELRPVIRQESARRQVNPVFVAAVLFDEMRHAKPGEDLPIAARSGLFSTHGPAQLGVGELIHQGLLPADATPEQIATAREQLLDPDTNVRVLAGKFARLSRDLGLPKGRMLQASLSARDAKAIATLAYLHNGKLDYPRRILRSMDDPELHAVLFGDRKQPIPPLI